MQARPEMTRLTAEIIATVCGKGRRTTRGYFKCCCPAHDDQRPSLLIYVKADGRLSFRCLALSWTATKNGTARTPTLKQLKPWRHGLPGSAAACFQQVAIGVVRQPAANRA